MQGANFGLMARHLALTEFGGHTVEELEGGLLAVGRGLWAAVWQPAAITDAEAWVMQLAETAETRGLTWDGVLALCLPQDEKSAALTTLGSALESFGYARQRAANAVAPEMVLVLGKLPPGKTTAGLECSACSMEDIEALLPNASAQTDTLCNPQLWGVVKLPGEADLIAARLDGQLVGFTALSGTDLVSRIASMWVEPDYRGKGVGRALVTAANKLSGDAGRLVLTAWTQRNGQLRYFFGKLGFADAMSAQYYFRT